MRQSDAPTTDHDAEPRVPQSRPSWPLVVLAVLAILAASYAARDVLIPIAFAVLLALLLSPLLRRMRWLRLPDLASALVLVGGVALVFVLGVLLLAGQAQHWLAEAPATIQKVSRMLPAKLGPLADLAKTSDAVEKMADSGSQQDKPLAVRVQSQDVALAIVGVSSQFVGSAVIVFVLAYFLLAFSDTLLRQATSSRSSFNQKRDVVELIRSVESGISRYLATITLINVGLGIATGLMVWALGIRNPVLWGVMAATLNYVPHVGAFLCMLVLFLVGAVTHESISYGLLCAGLFMALTSVESYFITPFILSKSLQLSPLAVILAILLGGWLWGISGGLMAAPLLTIVKIICDQFESLRVWSNVLAGSAAKATPPPEAATARVTTAA
jgi:predicted PurR-regulated permease PerM